MKSKNQVTEEELFTTHLQTSHFSYPFITMTDNLIFIPRNIESSSLTSFGFLLGEDGLGVFALLVLRTRYRKWSFIAGITFSLFRYQKYHFASILLRGVAGCYLSE